MHLRLDVIVVVLGLALIACAERAGGPLEPMTDESGADPAQTDRSAPTLIGPSPRTSGAIAASPASALEPGDSNAWIFANFSGRMDPMSEEGIVVHDADGRLLGLEFNWSVGATTGLVIRPTEALRPNTIYAFRMRSDLVIDQAGNPLDNDDDRVGGEHPDDDIVFFYRTQRLGDQYVDLDRDGRWDSGSVFDDMDGNGAYDPAPAGTDTLLYDTLNDGSSPPFGDGQFNVVEPIFFDQNGNGVADPGDKWFDTIDNGVWDAEGEPLTLDLNGNGVFDAPAVGDPLPLLVDGFPPVMVPFSSNSVPGSDHFVHFVADDSLDTRAFVDASIAVRVVDEALLGGVVERTGLETPLPIDALVLVEHDTGQRVLGSTRYESRGPIDSDAFGLLTFTPDRELDAGVDYAIVVSAALADTAGNKLDRDRDGWADSGTRPNLVRRFRTEASRSDGTVVSPDVIPPEVVELESEQFSFVIIFSELVDPRTVTDATIVLESNGERMHGVISHGTRFLGDPNQGPEVRLVSTARFLPVVTSVRRGQVLVTTGVRDFAGHRIQRNSTWFWVARP